MLPRLLAELSGWMDACILPWRDKKKKSTSLLLLLLLCVVLACVLAVHTCSPTRVTIHITIFPFAAKKVF